MRFWAQSLSAGPLLAWQDHKEGKISLSADTYSTRTRRGFGLPLGGALGARLARAWLAGALPYPLEMTWVFFVDLSGGGRALDALPARGRRPPELGGRRFFWLGLVSAWSIER